MVFQPATARARSLTGVEDESRGFAAAASSTFDPPGSFKVCGNELQSHHSCRGFSEEIAEGSQRLWKSPFRQRAVAFHSRQTE